MKIFASFGNDKYYNCLNRIHKQAESFNFFDNIICYTDKDLKNDEYFWNKHGEFIEKNPRGYGYWIWKSYIIIKILKTMNENDILVYADSGCTLNQKGIDRLNEYIDIVNKSEFGILTFKLTHLVKTWTKMDLIKHFDAEKYLDTQQLVAGIFVLRKCDHVVNIFDIYFNTSCNYQFLNDNPSNLKNDETFIEHRHDQSIFSLIIKKYGGEMIEDETWFGGSWDTKYPIWATRIRE